MDVDAVAAGGVCRARIVLLANEGVGTSHLRHGTTTLFAALEVATGKVTDACHPRHRHQEFLHFLKHLAKTYPRVDFVLPASGITVKDCQ